MRPPEAGGARTTGPSADGPRRAVHRSAATGYSLAADRYAGGRPDYPPEVDLWLTDELRLSPGCLALDLGAGTGKFTPYLLRTGAEVIAIEPVAEMRERLQRSCSGAEAMAGTATDIPVADATVDAVICAQSFHWFATSQALAEISRVLKPSGRLGLIWNMRDERVAWVRRLAEIIAPHEGDTPRFHSGAWRRAFPAEGFGSLSERTFRHGHRGEPERVIVDRILSTSFVAALPTDRRHRVAREIRALIAAEPDLAGREVVEMPYETLACMAIRT